MVSEKGARQNDSKAYEDGRGGREKKKNLELVRGRKKGN